MTLTPLEVKATSLLYVFGGSATLEQLSRSGGVKVGSMGNALGKMVKRGIATSTTAGSLAFFNTGPELPTERKGKFKIYSLSKPLRDIVKSSSENESKFVLWGKLAFAEGIRSEEEFQIKMDLVKDGLSGFAKSKGFGNYGKYLDSIIASRPNDRLTVAELVPPEIATLIRN